MSRSLIFETFRLEPANARLWRGSDLVNLAPKPFDLLCCLAEQPGKLVTKDELFKAAWPNLHVSESSLSVAINVLRLALGDDPKAPRFIETVPRRGYRFITPVTRAFTQGSFESSYLSAPAAPGLGLPRSRLFVGRASQIEALEDLFRRASAGTRQLAFVTGEAGIGKSTLIEMFSERIFERGVRVLLGRCVEHFGTDEAFLPLIEALQAFCAGPDGPMALN
ncbi:MAG: winged helix-turn-helix domain-containing protein, partial [Beijerinckiaceae bacterium]|nr:winged helix-turn-helix domain-containing protein [Beijerinckiaceae bacterium]